MFIPAFIHLVIITLTSYSVFFIWQLWKQISFNGNLERSPPNLAVPSISWTVDEHQAQCNLGYLDEDGYLWLTGRAKDVIMRGGHNIDPLIIEEVLAGHPSVSLTGAIGQPDIYSGELPCAYVELISGSVTSVEELMDYVQKNVSDHTACPKYIEILKEMPKTAIGKVFKPDLRRFAIIRTFNEALAKNDISIEVQSVVEDKKLGLVARLDKTDSKISDQKIHDALGEFITPWAWN